NAPTDPTGLTNANVVIDGAGAWGNGAYGNLIGTDPLGLFRAGAKRNLTGILITNAPNNHLGVGPTEDGNTPGNAIISTEDATNGFLTAAVFIRGANSTGNTIQANTIGTKSDGLSVIAPDPLGGVFADRNGQGVRITDGASKNTVGGARPSEGN